MQTRLLPAIDSLTLAELHYRRYLVVIRLTNQTKNNKNPACRSMSITVRLEAFASLLFTEHFYSI